MVVFPLQMHPFHFKFSSISYTKFGYRSHSFWLFSLIFFFFLVPQTTVFPLTLYIWSLPNAISCHGFLQHSWESDYWDLLGSREMPNDENKTGILQSAVRESHVQGRCLGAAAVPRGTYPVVALGSVAWVTVFAPGLARESGSLLAARLSFLPALSSLMTEGVQR